MPKGLSGMISLRRQVPSDEVAVAGPAAEATPQRNPRVGLWVLSTFATVASLVAISALVIGPENADAMVVVPLVLFWSVAVCVGFAVRSALMNVVRSLAGLAPGGTTDTEAVASHAGFRSRHKEEKPDATMERLARMARVERKREELYPSLARHLVHA